MITLKDVIGAGLKKTISNLNGDPFFAKAGVRFSSNVDHAIDRIVDRKIDELEVIRFLIKSINDHKCEIIYCCHLENPPLRLNIKNDDMILGFSIQVKNGIRYVQLRTVIKNFKGRKDSRISTYQID